jgi:RNA polymerase sigma factor for flagellar operon FliA
MSMRFRVGGRKEAPGADAMRATPVKRDMRPIWEEYKRTPDEYWRNTLMEHYLPLVRYNAERIAAKLPDEVDYEDLASAGVFGLMDAIDSFDLTRGVKFETYCAPRIRGAMLDELRSMDWVPRLVRTRAHKLERVSRELRSMLGREPMECEIAERLKMQRAEFLRLLRDATAVSQVSLSRKYGETDSNREVCEIDVIEDKRGRDPLVEIQKKDLKALITRGLNRAERLILILYYYEEMTMKEIGATLDLSESRVSQMHSSILARLKAQLDLRKRELVH